MDGIQPYLAPARAPVQLTPAVNVDPTQAKTPADYSRRCSGGSG